MSEDEARHALIANLMEKAVAEMRRLSAGR